MAASSSVTFFAMSCPPKARLGALGNIDLEGIGTQHVADVPAKPAGKALEDELIGSLTLGIEYAAFPGVLGDAGHAGSKGHGDFCGAAEGTETHRRDHYRHAQVERFGTMLVTDDSAQINFREDVVARSGGNVGAKGQVGQVRHEARSTVAADPITAGTGLDVDVFLGLGVPVRVSSGKGMERHRAHTLFDTFVA